MQKSTSFTVFSYNATVLLIQPNPTMDGPNPCPSLSRVVSVLDSGAEGPGFKISNRSRDAVG